MNNIFNYRRRATVDVNVGGVMLGSSHEVRVQSMTNTNTDDIEASVAQSQRIADAGGDIVRLTAQGVKEAENIGRIRTALREQGRNVPLVADIHFNPKAAFAAATVTDKVRINPGNFVDPARQFKSLSYTDEEYQSELQRIHDALVPFIDICREHHTAVRLGVNHGSLSDRIMSRYGNTAAGIVESVMEFLRVFVEQKFFDVVISMKASNVVVMVEAVRRVVAAMDAEDMHFPLHLGVTEAGFGEDGRIKSAVGIGCLMSEGLGDTIRVSLSEDPEVEVPVAQKLVQYITGRAGHDVIEGEVYEGYDALTPQRRRSLTVLDKIGGRKVPVVVASCAPEDIAGKLKPDYYFADGALTDGTKTYPLVPLADFAHDAAKTVQFVQVAADASKEQLQMLKGLENVVVIATAANMNVTGSLQAMLHTMVSLGVDCPVVVRVNYADTDTEWLQVKAGADLGTLLLNGFADGIWLEAPHYDSQQKVVEYAFAILQAARLRTSKTEFISCPSCGRTMFDLQTTVQQVKAATSHLTHLKIGVMGCVVNGPGEMADADYGYVGAARHSISLYKGKECIERNVPETEAIPRLVALIKANGDWVEP
ncbi:MAG: (E)-4-hydroxy-3-methylbut-2-enyl-diphosphate synthase [Bacteroidales bacterium]|nr:(E)-4-hydroxy-3-methylbut-2-enyl-diphosphate synthase [Bacteroidales bacterium]